jgi:hypothetical protein
MTVTYFTEIKSKESNVDSFPFFGMVPGSKRDETCTVA